MSQAVGQLVEGLKASMSDGSTVSINGRPVRLLHVSDNRARLELGWRVSPSTTIHLKVEPPGGEPIVMKSRVVSARVATVKDGTITYSAEVTFESLTSTSPTARPSQATTAVAAKTSAEPTAEPVAPPAVRPTAIAPVEEKTPDLSDEMRALQEELAARRAELAEERERRQKGEETAHESERRYGQFVEEYEAQKRRWEDERTTLSTELQAADARTADLQTALDKERLERTRINQDENSKWETERAALVGQLQAAETRAAALMSCEKEMQPVRKLNELPATSSPMIAHALAPVHAARRRQPPRHPRS